LGLGVPDVSYAVTGCTNANLIGTYTEEVANANMLNLLNSLNTSTGTSTGGGSSTSTFVNSPFIPGSSSPPTQFYLDGQGNIVAQDSTAAGTTVGSYSVNTDCSASISLVNGNSFNAVLVAGGASVLYIQNNAGSGGAIGTLRRYTGTCLADVPQSLGFSFFGAQRVSTTSGSTGTGSTSAPAVTLYPVSAVGQLQLDGQGGFTMREWVYQYGKTTTTALSGTYTVGSDCGLSLTFAPSANGRTATVITAPLTFKGGLVNATGTFVPQ
jgi:hypothetical protein